ncbi:Acyl-CoA dehydrogenase family member 9, mitochondrial [Habropoda laboriosa]|uniref:Acyl-CoA dehydrogenase family member 9, mitochondrial n=1 Tax=Habropoda laboriosa TaxID=597456 RepID=A0A0L7RGK4_9HYME|nr:PREDICTED: acyl-CoA dehydrogenase family member 9, mitochondrial-like [Habropoda laboriosa]KOC70000.1 Acyl-CoA dehydrogenase family member 9, mitochondrial [Habropoda laboriosa]
MFTQKLLQKNKIFHLKSNYMLKRYLKEATATGLTHENILFEPHAKKKPQREPFIKCLIAKTFSEELFAYPETHPYRYQNFVDWLKPIESYILSCVNNDILDKKEILDQLRELEVFRAHIDEGNRGLNFSKTESLKLIETLSILPWLGTYIVKNHILPIEIIFKYGAKEQMFKYYPKIMSGEITPTICINEGDYGTNINNIKSYIVTETEDTWLLNGEKTFVVNGINSNLFLVIARDTGSRWLDSPDSFSLLLVERDFEGVTCNNVCEAIGRHDTSTCTICFKDTVIPTENIIGKPGSAFPILLEYLKPGNQNVTAQAISILRNFTNQLIVDIFNIKHFDKNLYEFDIAKKILGEITFSLYSMESVAYLTSGIIDKYENQNAEIEQIITETYCANKCLSCIQAGLQLIGARSCLHNKLYTQAFHDALALTTMDANNLDALTYVAVNILKDIGKESHTHVHKKRNMQKYPIYNIIDSIFKKQNSVTSISKYLHPSLEYGAQHLEDTINLLSDGVARILIRNGSEIVDKFTELQKITEMLTEIYVVYANLTRSSRSYSIGVRNADIEKNIGVNAAYITHNKIHSIVSDIERGPVHNGDYGYINTMEFLYGKRKYPIEHPMTRTY